MKKYLSLALVLAFAFSFTSIAFAQAPFNPIGNATANNIGTTGPINGTGALVTMVMGLVGWVAWAVGLAAVVMGLYAGILFITGQGEPEKITTARNILLYAIIGIAVAILAFSLVSISKSVFGI